jgi:membrane protein YdbS with pleckstrin-like domain
MGDEKRMEEVRINPWICTCLYLLLLVAVGASFLYVAKLMFGDSTEWWIDFAGVLILFIIFTVMVVTRNSFNPTKYKESIWEQ